MAKIDLKSLRQNFISHASSAGSAAMSALRNKYIQGTAKTVGASALAFSLYSAAQSGYHKWRANAPEEGFKPDAIAVLSGGNGRIRTGIDLLQQSDITTQLLVSGAHPDHTDPYKLMDHLEYGVVEKFVAAGRIDIRANAITTQGNAEEILNWLAENPDAKDLLIVTSHYHIARAELEMSRVLPEDINVRYLSVQSGEGMNVGMTIWEVYKVGVRSTPGLSALYDAAYNVEHVREPYTVRYQGVEEDVFTAPDMDGQN